MERLFRQLLIQFEITRELNEVILPELRITKEELHKTKSFPDSMLKALKEIYEARYGPYDIVEAKVIVGLMDWCHEQTKIDSLELLAEVYEFDGQKVKITIEPLED